MAGLKEQAYSGVRWTSLNAVCTTALQFLQLAVLARLLDPTAYGLMAMVMVVIGLANVFADTGLSAAIIQRKDVRKEELSTLYWINILAGLVIYALIYLGTPLIARGFNAQELHSLLPVASLSFVIGAFGLQFQTLLRRELRFDVLTKIQVAAAFFGMIVAVGCALKGYGVWSLVWGNLGNTGLRTILLIVWGSRADWWPTFQFGWSASKGYLSFGLYRTGAMVANYFNSTLDQLVIGSLMGPEALGYYYIAVRLMIQPIQRINPILTNVAFPVFSKVQDDTSRLRKGFLQMSRLLATCNAPVLIGLAAVAPLAIPFLVGPQWLPAVPLVQVLAFYVLFRSLGNASGSLIMAKGKANWTLYWNISLILLVAPVVYAASLGGQIIHVAFALAGLQFVLFFCLYRILIRKLIGPCFMEYISAVGRPILLALLMSGIVLAASLALPPLPLTVALFVQVGIGALVYIMLSWLFQRELFFEVVELLPACVGAKRRMTGSG